jgi:uncharacterized protein (TIGR03437 family)
MGLVEAFPPVQNCPRWRYFVKKFNSLLLLSLLLCVVTALQAQSIGVDKTTLSFFAQVNGPAVQQTLQVTGTGNFVTGIFPLGSWLSVTPISGTAPSALTVTANPAGLAPSTYHATLTVSPSNLQNPVNVDVFLTVSNIGASPSSVQLTYQMNSPTLPTQAISLTGIATTFTATPTTTNGGSWLAVTPTTGNSPGTITVSLVQSIVAGLATGTYNGNIAITSPGNGNSPINIPVTLTVSPAPPVTVSPTQVSLSYQVGGSNNSAQQVVTLSTTGSQAVGYSLQNLTVGNNPSGRTWFTATPLTGNIPAAGSTTITFAYDTTANLPAGTYTGSAILSTPGGTPTSTTIPVQLTVSTSPLLSASNTNLSFTYQVGTAGPASQNVTVSSTNGSAPLTLAANANGGAWLTVPATATAGVAFAVSVNPAGLAPGNYTGTVTVSSQGAANSPLTINVTLKVTNDPVIIVSANGCSTAVFNSCSLTFADEIGQAQPLPQSIQISSSTGATLNYTAAFASTACGGNWITLNPSTGSTTGFITAAANPAGVSAGTCSGTITITATNASTNNPAPNSPFTIPVTMYVSNSALLLLNPSGLTFSTQVNGATPPSQSILLNSTDPANQLSYTVTATTSNGANWLFVSPLSGTTASPQNVVAVLAVPGILSAGTYTGTVTITATGPGGAAVANSPVSIPVSFQVNAGTIAATPASLNFTQVAGGTAPAAQTVNVTGTPAPINYSASGTTDNGGNWLTVTGSGTTPGTVSVSVSAGTLSAGTYTGHVIITAATPPGATGSPINIPVTFTVAAAQTLTVSPSTLNFTYTQNGTAPAAQTVAVSSTGSAPAPFTVTTSSSATWLQATPTSGNTPANLSVSVTTTGLTPGKYTGTVTINSSMALQPATVTVNLTVAAPTPPVLLAVANAASYAATGLAPGENIVIGGTSIGPPQITGLQLNSNGTVATTVANTTITFDGIPAPIVYVSATQSSVMVPYEISGRATTTMIVTYNGTPSAPVVYNVVPTSPGIYTQNAQGTGLGAILNQDFSLNGPNNRAAKGSTIAVYMTGEGITNPPSTTGGVATGANSLNHPVLPVTATVGGVAATVAYAGSAPGDVYGIMQVNVTIPAGAASGASVPIVISVGNTPSQSGVTVAIQ